MKSSIALLYLSFIGLQAFTQTESHEHHNHQHGHSHDGHHKNEIGVANAPVYYVKEKEFTYGLHLHYIHQLGSSKFGLGLGYEKIFDDHEHQTVGLVANYRFPNGVSFNVAPGVTWEHNHTDELNFALHLEAVYEWEFGNFHLGPVAEFAYDPEDYHLSLGLHLGYGF